MDGNKDLLSLAVNLLNEACEENRRRDTEIMQGVDGEREHAKTVLSWVEKLTENPSVELEIAALFHDIDRLVTPGVGGGFKGDRRSVEYEAHKKAHAKRSADYARRKLLQNDVNSRKLVERIGFLISHHDDTGEEVESLKDKELDILVGADTFAFFDSIAPRLYEAEGEQRLMDKIIFMVEKIPVSAQKILYSQKLENEIFERLKNEAIEEVRKWI